MAEELQWLAKMDVSRASRDRGAARLLANPALATELVLVAFGSDIALAKRALWILEIAGNQQPSILLPLIPQYIRFVPTVSSDPLIRALAKIGEVFCLWADREGHLPHLPEQELIQLTSIFFTWLNGPYKVAAKAHAMTSLFCLGKQISWIHADLANIITRAYPTEKPGYQARARITLEAIKKYNKEAR